MKKLHLLALLILMAGDAILTGDAMDSSLFNEAPVNQGQFQAEPINQEQSDRTTNTGILYSSCVFVLNNSVDCQTSRQMFVIST